MRKPRRGRLAEWRQLRWLVRHVLVVARVAF